jgi:D-3-phosphoglycerate dehydrogenase
MGIRHVSFDEILAESDYISIHTPKTAETTNLFNKETLARMKQGAMLINCARGGIVNEDDLHEALVSNHLGGAALDVFVTEPPGKICLMDLDNFICTSHLGASTHEAQDNVARDVATQIVEYLKTGQAQNIVNLKK